MAEELRALTEGTYQAVVSMLGRVGALPPRVDQLNRGQPSGNDQGEWVQVTSGTPTGSLYPANVVYYSSGAWHLISGAVCWFLPANGETPTNGANYHARVVGTDGTYTIYSDNIVSSGGASGVTVNAVNPGTGDTTISFASATTIETDQTSGLTVVSGTGGHPRLQIEAASNTHTGAITTGVQSLAGDKTFQSGSVAVQPNGASRFGFNSTTAGINFAGSITEIESSQYTSKPGISIVPPAGSESGVMGPPCVQVSLDSSNALCLILDSYVPPAQSKIVIYNYAGSAWGVGQTGTGGGGDTFTGGICTALGAGGSTIIIGSTTVPGGTNGDILYISSGTVGQLGTPASVIVSGGNLILSGDAGSPGNSQFYGTNGSGTKGWYAQSSIADPVFTASGTGHAAGDVPDPGSTAGTARYLREDATWVVPPGEELAINPVATDQSTTSATMVDLASADSVSFTAPASGKVLIEFFSQTYNSSTGGQNFSQVMLDGVLQGSAIGNSIQFAGAIQTQAFQYQLTGLSAGSHTVKIQHDTNTGGTAHWLARVTRALAE